VSGTVRVYKSTDASAPSLDGTAGSLITVLDACLVNGYGTQPSAGWSKAFSASNQATYKGGSGVQHFFHVDDNSPNVTAAGKEAQFRGSETATAFQTGTGFFPTTAQIALGAGLVIRKSTTATSTARAWVIVADDRTCHIFVLTGDTASVYMGAMFGEFYSLDTVTDSYRSIVIGRVTANSGTISTTIEMLPVLVPSVGTTENGHFVARNYSGVGTSAAVRKWGDTARGNATALYNMGSQGLSLPEPVTSEIHVAPIHITDLNQDVRGRMRGFFHVCHNASPLAVNGGIADLSTVAGTGVYAGRTFLVLASLNNYVYFIDITGPWETN
jgi:hypothetical protein